MTWFAQSSIDGASFAFNDVGNPADIQSQIFGLNPSVIASTFTGGAFSTAVDPGATAVPEPGTIFLTLAGGGFWSCGEGPNSVDGPLQRNGKVPDTGHYLLLPARTN